ncbi:MAG: SGNH/GDSL hydrolase family protein [Cyanobacteria bacterium REEB67]|nr:SGNH/GDSL hydrolase family protein [Cyanobacteria bacterium REEB67]
MPANNPQTDPLGTSTAKVSELDADSSAETLAAAASNKFTSLAIIQGILYAALCLLVLEAVFAATHVGESEYLMPDKVCGFTLMPNKLITQRKEGFGSFKSNSFGMQNQEISLSKPEGVLRIAVFGDSYVESLHVGRESNFLQVTARQLAEKLHQPVQVLNFGVSNYSVAQDYLRYQTLAKKFNPDLVIQVFRVEESDKLLPQASNYLSLVRPVFLVGDHGELVYDDSHVRAFFNSSTGKKMITNHWLRHDSRLWCVIGQFSQNLTALGKSLAGKDKKENGTLNAATNAALDIPANLATARPAGLAKASTGADEALSNKERYITCYWYMMDKQLESFKNECLANGSAFMILRTPMIRAEMDALRVNKTESRLLAETATRIQAPVFNLDTLFKEQFGLKNDGSHFLSGGHFNGSTHEWVGQNLSDYLHEHRFELGLAVKRQPAPGEPGRPGVEAPMAPAAGNQPGK